MAGKEEIVSNIYQDWNGKFGAASGIDKRVVMLTGETGTDLKLLNKAHIVVSFVLCFFIVYLCLILYFF